MDADLEMRLCQAIETVVCAEYDVTPELTDTWCIPGLDNSIIALKQKFGYAKNETVLSHPEIRGMIEQVTNIDVAGIGQPDGMTLKDYIVVIQKIKRSVIRHSASGPRAYYDFVRNYV